MAVIKEKLEFKTGGDAHIVEITGEIGGLLRKTALEDGIVNVFVPGATGAITTLEHEPGVCRDFQELFDFIAPVERDYYHNRRGVDSNGHSHVRAGLLGPSLTVPFQSGKLQLGTWQQVVFVDFDEVPRERTLVLTFIGE
ncbi:MAG: secondary thiamine-phosphate synthase enzyme YjbQ [Actinomycetota bacterium]|nr:secondary thiamine-phosphate synthase enzyme YjbQ [Actinomycetota bacterium]MDD5666103.1 secondary thiamine-phosphate synthase enzyme YjbQ [Actinomycetota bacterium]